MPGPAITVFAPAKLNVWLDVLGRRADGYHELVSEFVAIDLCDTIRITPAAVDALHVAGPASAGVPTDRGNLVWTVLDAWRDRCGDGRGWRIDLLKRIPAQAGLGGGSSDAAAALWAANRIAGEPVDSEGQHAICAAAGSDLNVFLAWLQTGTSRAIARGRGERVEVRPHQPRSAIVAVPPQGVSTAALFGALDAPPLDRQQARPPRTDANALQTAAERADPELARFRCRLQELTGQTWQMTGSGSSYFSWGKNPSSAKKSARKLSAIGYDHVAAVRTRPPVFAT